MIELIASWIDVVSNSIDFSGRWFDLESGRKEAGLSSEQQMDRFLQGVQISAYRMAQLACGQREEALDLVQDAMLRFATRYSDKPQEQWKPLFYRTLNTRIVDWHRRQKVRSIVQWFGCTQEFEVADTSGGSPERQHQQGQAVRQLDSVLKSLPEKQRQAIILRVWEELSTAETAVAMGCSPSSVKTHLARGLKTVRLQLGGHWP